MIGLLQQDPLAFALAFSALLLSLSLHEWGHAYAAFRFGDPTARRLGRLTLNPLRHLDPLGTVLLLLVGFGWARPVPVNPGAFRRYRLGLFVVSVAGIAVNLALAVLFALCVRGLFALDPWGVVQTFRGGPDGHRGLGPGPLLRQQPQPGPGGVQPPAHPPLDGSKILQSLLPFSWQPFLWRLEQYAWLSFLLIVTVLRGPIQEVLAFARRVFFGVFFG